MSKKATYENVVVDTTFATFAIVCQQKKLEESEVGKLKAIICAAERAGLHVEVNPELSKEKVALVYRQVWPYIFDSQVFPYLAPIASKMYMGLHGKRQELIFHQTPDGVIRMQFVHAQLADQFIDGTVLVDSNKQVHHLNGCHYDNRTKNMTFVSKSEHSGLHHQEMPKPIPEVLEEILYEKLGDNYDTRFLENLIKNFKWLCIHIEDYSGGKSHRGIAIAVSDSIFEKDFSEMELEDVIREIKILDKGK